MNIIKKLWYKYFEFIEKHPIHYFTFLSIGIIILLFNGEDKHLIEIILLGIAFVGCCFVLFVEANVVGDKK